MLKRSVIWLAVFLCVGLLGAQGDFPPPGEVYTINGRQMHLHCTGQGSPTVILEAGVGGFSLNWSRVQPGVAQFTRVCSYDRAGYGWSDPLDGEFSVEGAIDDLVALLDAAEVAPPYVMVGHSFGGVLVRAYHERDPDEVVGLVLVDAVPPQMAARIPFYETVLEVQLEGLRFLSGLARLQAAEGAVIPASSDLPEDIAEVYIAKQLEEKFFETSAIEARYMVGALPSLDLPDDLGNLPLVVIAHGIPERSSFLGAPLNPDLAAEAEATWQELQREQAALSENSDLVIAQESRHNIQFQQPELVIEAVRGTIKQD